MRVGNTGGHRLGECSRHHEFGEVSRRLGVVWRGRSEGQQAGLNGLIDHEMDHGLRDPPIRRGDPFVEAPDTLRNRRTQSVPQLTPRHSNATPPPSLTDNVNRPAGGATGKVHFKGGISYPLCSHAAIFTTAAVAAERYGA